MKGRRQGVFNRAKGHTPETVNDGRSDSAIELIGVRKQFGDLVAVDELDLAVPRGATYGLLGPNGAGKTTTIRLLLRILEPDAGELRVFGQPVRRNLLDRVGYLPEERGLYRSMNIRPMLSFLAQLKGVSPRESGPRIEAWLERFGLEDRGDDKVQDFSKGMQQKLQFIAAVLHEPDVVVLDEPFSGLDPINKEVIADIRQTGRTILLSTHLIEYAERLCDHVCIIDGGRKVVDGPVDQVKREHGGTHVALTLDGVGRVDTATLVEKFEAMSTVTRVLADGNDLEVTLEDNAGSNDFLASLVSNGIRLQRFARVEPSLQQIFIERVGVDPATGTRADV
jgi:ABC-2 type transport system ATP-binding protein